MSELANTNWIHEYEWVNLWLWISAYKLNDYEWAISNTLFHMAGTAAAAHYNIINRTCKKVKQPPINN